MAWDDTKSKGNQLTSTEWNNHVTDQKNRLKNDGSVSLQANQVANGYTWQNLASPSNANDAATKDYVDNNSGGSGSPETQFHLSGGAVTLGDGQLYILKKWVAPSAQDITANHGGISSLADGTHVTGLEIRVNNITQGTTSTLINSNYYSDSTGTTVSITSGDEVNIELYNSTGSTQDIVADVGGVIV